MKTDQLFPTFPPAPPVKTRSLKTTHSASKEAGFISISVALERLVHGAASIQNPRPASTTLADHWMLAARRMILSDPQLALLAQANLRGADLRGANLAGADFSEADLLGANIQGATLGGVTFRNTRMPDGSIR